MLNRISWWGGGTHIPVYPYLTYGDIGIWVCGYLGIWLHGYITNPHI